MLTTTELVISYMFNDCMKEMSVEIIRAIFWPTSGFQVSKRQKKWHIPHSIMSLLTLTHSICTFFDMDTRRRNYRNERAQSLSEHNKILSTL